MKLPGTWLAKLARARNASTLKLTCFLHYRNWKSDATIVVSNSVIKPWGLTRGVKETALSELERLGLIRVDRATGARRG